MGFDLNGLHTDFFTPLYLNLIGQSIKTKSAMEILFDFVFTASFFILDVCLCQNPACKINLIDQIDDSCAHFKDLKHNFLFNSEIYANAFIFNANCTVGDSQGFSLGLVLMFLT